MKFTTQSRTPVLVVAVLALFFALGGVGHGANNDKLTLGQSNAATATTSLSAPVVGGKALQLTNNNSSNTSSTALGLTVAAGHAPFTVNSSTKVTNLNGDFLDGLDSTRFWNTLGNALCTTLCLVQPFIGTTNNQPLVFKVNGQRALLLQPNATSPNVVGGFSGNSVSAGVVGATIAGGGSSTYTNVVTDNHGTVAGGLGNLAGNEDATPSNSAEATVGGGVVNSAKGFRSTIAGGSFNTATGYSSVIGGGGSNEANGLGSTVSGGESNEAIGEGSAIPGGFTNTATGHASFAAGRNAQANHNGTFVWGDDHVTLMASTAANQFIARAVGHFFLQSDSTLDNQNGFINTSTTAFLSTGGAWTNASSRSLKAGFTSISPTSILEKVAALPVTSWHYKTQPRVRHIGPVSEDFYRAFGVGDNAKSIGTVDEGGVALAAIKGLYRQNKSLRRENRSLRTQLDAQDARLTRLERAFSKLSQ
jgi:hypothetical protein